MTPRKAHDVLDELLVLNAQAGDRQAFAEIYRRWSPRLERHIGRLVNDRHATLDVAQNVWMSIARGIRRLDDPTSFASWSYRIATHKAADWTRDVQRRRRLIARAPGGHADARAEKVDLDPVRAAIRSLSPDQRALLSMHYADGLSLSHIGHALQIPIGTVKSRLHAARAEVRRILEHKEACS